MKFYGQFSPPLDNYLYTTFFKNKIGGVSIECGASNGLLENTTKFFEEYLNWKTINIEPLPEWYSELIINRPNSININRAIHPYEDNLEIQFNIPYHNTGGYKNHLGSLNKENLLKYNTNIKCIDVKTITFNTIIKNNNITELDLFVLDIEGYEVTFLKTFNEWIIYPKVFVIEKGHYDNDQVITNIIKDKYTLHSTYFVNNIYILK